MVSFAHTGFIASMTRKEDAMSYQVGWEVGVLKQVIVHGPGREVTRLTPQNKEALLFDDLP